jgi:hypothetical protein
VIEAWLRAQESGEDGCPPPEVWLAEELAALPPAARAALETHAAGCAACQAERALAQAWDTGSEGVDAADLAWVQERLAAAPGLVSAPAPPRASRSEEPEVFEAAAQPARVLPFRSRWIPAAVRYAAAAVLLLAVGLTVRTAYRPSPALPAPSADTVLRGGEVEPLAPLGELPTPPRELRWKQVSGAAGYHVRLLAPDDTVLLETDVTMPTAPLASAAQPLQTAVEYRWTVEARAADGRVLARSPLAAFRLAPGPETTP